MAKKTFIVTHPNLYLKVKGKLARVGSGTEVTIEEKDAASLLKQGKILIAGKGKKVDIASEETEK